MRAYGEVVWSRRRGAGVNAPGGNCFSGRYGGKTAVLRGEHEVSRKAIAQGMPDCLRSPVCSCAHFLCTLRARPRVQRASGIPCALCFLLGREAIANSGRDAPREREGVSAVAQQATCPGVAQRATPEGGCVCCLKIESAIARGALRAQDGGASATQIRAAMTAPWRKSRSRAG